MRIALAALAAVSLLLATVLGALAAGSVTGSMPSAVANDGKFIGLSGTGNETYSQPIYMWLGVPAGQTTLDIQVFDGDLGGLWDIHNPANSIKTTYTLYADPTKSSSTTGLTQVAYTDSDAIGKAGGDNAWVPLFPTINVGANAIAPSGYAFYLLWVQWDNPNVSNTEFNAFKIQADAQVSLVSGLVVAFDGGPNNVSLGPSYTGPIDPPLGAPARSDLPADPNNTYNGQWDWYAYVPPGFSSVTFTDCDADSSLNTASPGNPLDDDPTPNSPFRISPPIQYNIYDPSGHLVVFNQIPSGNNICEPPALFLPSPTNGLTFPSTTGLYHWQWVGVDAHNLVFQQVNYELFSAPVTPFPVGSASPTPTSTATPKGTTSPTTTASPTVAATNTPRPSSGGSSAPSAPPPAPTWTSTLVPSSTPHPATPTSSPTPTRTPIRVPKLPATGEAGLPIVPVATMGAALLLLGYRLRKRS
jgi:hypothetical protein